MTLTNGRGDGKHMLRLIVLASEKPSGSSLQTGYFGFGIPEKLLTTQNFGMCLGLISSRLPLNCAGGLAHRRRLAQG